MALAKAKDEVATEDTEAEFGSAQEVAKAKPTGLTAGGAGAVRLSDDDLSQLDLTGYGVFPTVTLDKGEFECDSELEFDKEFDCVIQQFQEKFFYSSKVSDSDHEFFYTLDKDVTTSGESIDEVTQQWKEEGRPAHTIKKYLQVLVQIVGGDNDGRLVLLSISPSSVAKFSGYVAGELAAVRRVHYKHAVTTVRVGEKITKAKFPFRPWAFSFKSVNAFGVEG